jgi:hypothetical protein
VTELTFGPPDIAGWARFSGDYNPIHFDAERARALGVEGVVAHGMLVLLAVKGWLSRELPPGGGWWTFKARMRQPVLSGRPALLDVRPQPDGLAFTLAAPAGHKLMTGALSRRPVVPYTPAPPRRLRIEADAVAARVRELQDAFPWPGEFWVAADALVFAEFVRTGIKDVLAPHGIDLGPGGESPADGTIVVQTAHEVAFDRHVLGAAPAGAAFDVEVLPPVSEAVEDGVAATCQLVTRCRDRVVLVTNLGLFIRRPQAAPASESRSPR